MLIAALFIWIGCGSVYLSSKQQKILPRRIRKDIAWSIFTLAVVLGTYLYAQDHLAVVAGLLTLANVMVMWLILVFSQGHYRTTALNYLIGGLAFALSSQWLGG